MLKWLKTRRQLMEEAAAERFRRERAEAREEHLKGENSKLLDAVEYTPTEREFALAEEVKDLRSRAATPADVQVLINAAELAYEMTGNLPAVIEGFVTTDSVGRIHTASVLEKDAAINTQEVRSALSDALGTITLPLVDQATPAEQERFDALGSEEDTAEERESLYADPMPEPEPLISNPILLGMVTEGKAKGTYRIVCDADGHLKSAVRLNP